MRQYLSAIAWIAVTTAVVAGAQIVTTKAAAERRTVTKLNIALVENQVRIRELQAELRTRAGMPELQRWNDAVFQLSAPQGAQILQSPLQLASFAARPDAAPAAGPSVQYAVTPPDAVPGAVPAPAAPRAPSTAGARVVNASFPTPRAPAPPVIELPATPDLLPFIAPAPPEPQADAF